MVIQTKKRKARLSVTVEPELRAVVDEIVRETKTNRSIVISQCLEELARNRKEVLMVKYYKTMASEHKEFAEKSVKVIQKIASSWSD